MRLLRVWLWLRPRHRGSVEAEGLGGEPWSSELLLRRFYNHFSSAPLMHLTSRTS